MNVVEVKSDFGTFDFRAMLSAAVLRKHSNQIYEYVYNAYITCNYIVSAVKIPIIILEVYLILMISANMAW